MPPIALSVLQDEHQALAAMLRSMSALLTQARHEQRLPDFDVLRAMLLYVDEFPERQHHRKESELLFPRLRERAPELGAVLDQLDRDHANGERAIRNLEHGLLAFEVLGEPRRAAFEEAVERYVDFYLHHMALEDTEVLPAAERCLSEADWIELDAAFAANRDPLTGHAPEQVYRPLFRRVLAGTTASPCD